MKKVFCLLLLVLAFSASVCYADDYLGEWNEDTGEYLAYLQTASITGRDEAQRGDPQTKVVYYFSVVLLPANEQTHAKLRSLMVDDRVAYKVMDYKFVGYYDRINHTGNGDDLYLYRLRTRCVSAGGNTLYKREDNIQLEISRDVNPISTNAVFKVMEKYR